MQFFGKSLEFGDGSGETADPAESREYGWAWDGTGLGSSHGPSRTLHTGRDRDGPYLKSMREGTILPDGGSGGGGGGTVLVAAALRSRAGPGKIRVASSSVVVREEEVEEEAGAEEEAEEEELGGEMWRRRKRASRRKLRRKRAVEKFERGTERVRTEEEAD
ncbi:hypothetical protein ACLB2K_002278 [Fragaria x ananassa]